jgi:hypothetical protein
MRRPLCIAVCGVALLLGGCGTEAVRQQARSVVDQVERAVGQREDAAERLLAAQTAAYFEQVQARLDAEWALALAQLRVEIHERCLRKDEELRGFVVGELERALDPVLQQINQDLNAEQAAAAAGGGNREREYLLAAQLSTTLALAQKEGLGLQKTVAEGIATVRREALQQLDALAAPARIEVGAAATAVLAEWKAGHGDAYREGIAKAAESLRGYIALQHPLQLFLDGLLPRDLGQALLDRIKSRAEQLLTAGKERIAAATSSLRTNLETRIESAARSLTQR